VRMVTRGEDVCPKKTKGCVAMTNHLKCITRQRTLPRPADHIPGELYLAGKIIAIVNVYSALLSWGHAEAHAKGKVE
jgi:hypothetical protein